jgi:hypothetical protein
MTKTPSIAELKREGISLTAYEAVAIVQKLIHERGDASSFPPFGPPSTENVEVTADGGVLCRACEITPAVPEVAILLQSLLPIGAPLPGGLRYVIARALHEVDAPPFDSLGDFSAAIARYERGDRTAVIRRLVLRAAAPARPQPRQPDRRRPTQTVADIRRHLIEADRQLYERHIAGGGRPPGARPWMRHFLAIGVASIAAFGLLAWTDGPHSRAAINSVAEDQAVSSHADIVLPSPPRPIDHRPVVRSTRGKAVLPGVPRPHPRARNDEGVFARIRFVDDFGAR